VPSPEEEEKKKKQKEEALRRGMQERRLYDEKVVKAGLLGYIKDPYRENLRDAIRKRVDSYSKSTVKASSGLMHSAREMYRDVTHMQTVEVPDELFDTTSIRYLMLGTGEMRRENERVHALCQKYSFYSFEGTRNKGDSCIYEYGAIKYPTNLNKHLTVNLERFMIRAVFALYPGISRKAIWIIIDSIKNDSKNEQVIEFVHEKTSCRKTNEASVIRAAIQEHRAALGLASPAEKISELIKDKKRYDRPVLRYSIFLNGELARRADMEQGLEANAVPEKREAALLARHFNVVRLREIKSHL